MNRKTLLFLLQKSIELLNDPAEVIVIRKTFRNIGNEENAERIEKVKHIIDHTDFWEKFENLYPEREPGDLSVPITSDREPAIVCVDAERLLMRVKESGIDVNTLSPKQLLLIEAFLFDLETEGYLGLFPSSPTPQLLRETLAAVQEHTRILINAIKDSTSFVLNSTPTAFNPELIATIEGYKKMVESVEALYAGLEDRKTYLTNLASPAGYVNEIQRIDYLLETLDSGKDIASLQETLQTVMNNITAEEGGYYKTLTEDPHQTAKTICRIILFILAVSSIIGIGIVIGEAVHTSKYGYGLGLFKTENEKTKEDLASTIEKIKGSMEEPLTEDIKRSSESSPGVGFFERKIKEAPSPEEYSSESQNEYKY